MVVTVVLVGVLRAATCSKPGGCRRVSDISAGSASALEHADKSTVCVTAWLAKEAWAAAERSRASPPASGQPDAAPASSGLTVPTWHASTSLLYTEADKRGACWPLAPRRVAVRPRRGANLHRIHSHRYRAADTGLLPGDALRPVVCCTLACVESPPDRRSTAPRRCSPETRWWRRGPYPTDLHREHTDSPSGVGMPRAMGRARKSDCSPLPDTSPPVWAIEDT